MEWKDELQDHEATVASRVILIHASGLSRHVRCVTRLLFPSLEMNVEWRRSLLIFVFRWSFDFLKQCSLKSAPDVCGTGVRDVRRDASQLHYFGTLSHDSIGNVL